MRGKSTLLLCKYLKIHRKWHENHFQAFIIRLKATFCNLLNLFAKGQGFGQGFNNSVFLGANQGINRPLFRGLFLALPLPTPSARFPKMQRPRLPMAD